MNNETPRELEGLRCDHGQPVERVTLGVHCTGCALRALSYATSPIAGADRADVLWLGRQIERHAARASEASARATDVARRLERIAALLNELVGEARELRRRSRDAIPFGGDGPDERTIQEWKMLAAHTESIVERLSNAASGEGT